MWSTTSQGRILSPSRKSGSMKEHWTPKKVLGFAFDQVHRKCGWWKENGMHSLLYWEGGYIHHQRAGHMGYLFRCFDLPSTRLCMHSQPTRWQIPHVAILPARGCATAFQHDLNWNEEVATAFQEFFVLPRESALPPAKRWCFITGWHKIVIVRWLENSFGGLSWENPQRWFDSSGHMTLWVSSRIQMWNEQHWCCLL